MKPFNFWKLALGNWNLNIYGFGNQKKTARKRASDDAPVPKSGAAERHFAGEAAAPIRQAGQVGQYAKKIRPAQN